MTAPPAPCGSDSGRPRRRPRPPATAAPATPTGRLRQRHKPPPQPALQLTAVKTWAETHFDEVRAARERYDTHPTD
ncbi:hypothetical protein AB0F36_12020 [Streptomyces sp. NPDC029080]|uniref:hypothetical protein n=1 Tax=unclassified Streptomyces TaxID=2593676 RepID=UPI001F40FA6B|nr:hypothetical protein [Streptomyces sp. SID486]